MTNHPVTNDWQKQVLNDMWFTCVDNYKTFYRTHPTISFCLNALILSSFINLVFVSDIYNFSSITVELKAERSFFINLSGCGIQKVSSILP